MWSRIFAAVFAVICFMTGRAEAEAVSAAELQAFLNQRKCDAGPVDGVWGKRSGEALKRFATRMGQDAAHPVSRSLFDAMQQSDAECEAVAARSPGPSSSALHRTWANAVVSIPQSITATGKFCRGVQEKARIRECIDDVRPDARTPAILFMHGCDGMNLPYVTYLGSLGYPVFAPDSLARGNRQIDCRFYAPDKPRSILRARLEEAEYALRQMRALPWIDSRRIILTGFSEGGVTTALHERNDVLGKMIFGWSCNALDPWWRGVRGSRAIPVLAVTGADDPYHKNHSNRGDCGPFIRNRPNSSSLILPNVEHDIIRNRQAQGAIRDFVQSLLTP